MQPMCVSLHQRAQRPMGVGGRAWRAGKKRDSRSATFLCPMRCATSRVILKYGSCRHRKRFSLHFLKNAMKRHARLTTNGCKHCGYPRHQGHSYKQFDV